VPAVRLARESGLRTADLELQGTIKRVLREPRAAPLVDLRLDQRKAWKTAAAIFERAAGAGRRYRREAAYVGDLYSIDASAPAAPACAPCSSTQRCWGGP